jgi:aspartyl-tRNA(Asn)/glutamyl-tRNA(Gln) amidotransferase subunit C
MPTPDVPSASDSPTELSLEEVRHLAALARLGMTDEMGEKFRGELAGIIGHCAALTQIDTDGVEPTNNGADLVNVLAPDVSRPAWPIDKVLANATTRDDTLIRVRAVLE